MQLKGDKKQAVIGLLEHPGFRPLLEYLDEHVVDQEKQLLSMQLTPENEREVILSKARAQGARRLITNFINGLNGLRKASDKAAKPSN